MVLEFALRLRSLLFTRKNKNHLTFPAENYFSRQTTGRVRIETRQKVKCAGRSIALLRKDILLDEMRIEVTIISNEGGEAIKKKK